MVDAASTTLILLHDNILIATTATAWVSWTASRVTWLTWDFHLPDFFTTEELLFFILVVRRMIML